MAKLTFFALFALLAVVAVTADTQEAVPVGQEHVELYGWSCTHGGNAACSVSCAAQGHFKGGKCNSSNTCICN